MSRIRTDYRHTIYACYIGYITQAVVNNFAPLLFLTFQTTYRIPLSQISLLVTVNFCTQLLVDLLSAKYVDRIGYRRAVILAHLFAASGLLGLGIFPDIFPDAFWGLCAAVVLYAIGGGLTEVLISPILEACPTEKKSAAMSLLHSFYCWGSVLVVLLSTVWFRLFGVGTWKLLAAVWALIPLLNSVYFSQVPIQKLVEDGDGMRISDLLRTGIFWILALLMFCSGASELAMSQWASAFAESGLHVSKTVGDLAGPCMFAAAMGCARVLHARLAGKADLYQYLGVCALLCVLSYVLASMSPWAVLSLIGCGLCGVAVGAMWPGTFSLASRECPRGGTALFAFLALAGDAGCASGPALVGLVSAALGDDLKRGLLFACVFPVLLIAGLVLCRRHLGTSARQ